MNTSKILEIVPQAVPAPTPPVAPPRNAPQAVQPVGHGAATDAIQQHAQRQADTAEAEHKRAAAKPAQHHTFNREVGLVDDTFEVFIDLVSPALKSTRFRIFGPSEDQAAPPPLETSDPAGAHAAYADVPAKPPVLKTDV